MWLEVQKNPLTLMFMVSHMLIYIYPVNHIINLWKDEVDEKIYIYCHVNFTAVWGVKAAL